MTLNSFLSALLGLNRAGVERSIATGGRVNATSAVDGKSAYFRAAVFGHAEVVRLLLASARILPHAGRTDAPRSR